MNSYEYDGDLEALLHDPAEREKLVAKVWTDGYGRSGQHLWETRDLLSTLLVYRVANP